MPRHKGVRWESWSTCERCNFEYPLGMLVVQKGIRLCTVHCLDNLDIEYRPFIIQSVLEQNEEQIPETQRLYDAEEEIIF